MENLGDIYDYVNLALNKAQRSGFVSARQFNTALKAANLELFVDARSFYQETSQLSDDAQAVIKTVGDSVNPTPLLVNTSGVVDFPNDYRYFSSMSWKKVVNAPGCEPDISYVPVEFLTDAQWNARLDSALKRGTTRHPIMTVRNGKIIVSPVGNRYVLTYWRDPIVPFYDYILSNGSYSYLVPGASHDGTNPDPGISSGDSSRSVEPEWPDLKRFADKVLRILAGNKRANQVYQEALIEMQKQQQQWSSKSS